MSPCTRSWDILASPREGNSFENGGGKDGTVSEYELADEEVHIVDEEHQPVGDEMIGKC